MDEKGKVDKSKEKFGDFVEKEITSMFGILLDYVEVGVPDKDRYRVLRSKILRCCNDTKRAITKEVFDNYKLEFVPPGHDVIVVRKR
jgi:hypothetical protein